MAFDRLKGLADQARKQIDAAADAAREQAGEAAGAAADSSVDYAIEALHVAAERVARHPRVGGRPVNVSVTVSIGLASVTLSTDVASPPAGVVEESNEG